MHFFFDSRVLLFVSESSFSLSRLKKEDIEMVRNWRNQDFVRNNLITKDIITSEQQAKWFESIPSNKHYFIASLAGQKGESNPYGMFFFSQNEDKNEAESGGFIGEINYLNGPYSFAASYLLNAIIFQHFKMNAVLTSVLGDNEHIVRYNQFLGYEPYHKINDIHYLKLTNQKWEEKSSTLRRIIFSS